MWRRQIPGLLAVPDVFINGYLQRVQGASSSSTVRERISKIVGNLVTEKNEYTIEADVRIDGSDIQANCRIARLGNRASDEMLLKMRRFYLLLCVLIYLIMGCDTIGDIIDPYDAPLISDEEIVLSAGNLTIGDTLTALVSATNPETGPLTY